MPLAKAVDAIGRSIQAAVNRRRQSGFNPVLASESYEEDEFEEPEDMEDDGAVPPLRCGSHSRPREREHSRRGLRTPLLGSAKAAD